MSIISSFFYDRMLAATEEACLRDWRKALLKNASGNVLEIGAGTGANLDFYTDAVQQLTLTEPDKHMRRQLQKKLATIQLNNISLRASSAESIDAADNSFDFVTASLVCCSIVDPHEALLEIKRVLKPDGRFIFLEHVAAKAGSRRRRWQNFLNPVWRPLMGNCHLNRETESTIIAAGFNIIDIQRESMRKATPLVRPCIRGIAVKP